MGMAAVIYEKGAPDNFVWEEVLPGVARYVFAARPSA